VRAARCLALVVVLATAGSAAAGTTYVVRRGDTLSGIAARYGLSAGALARANHLRNPHHILAGARLTIPVPAADLAPRSGLPRRLLAHPERLKLLPTFDRWAEAYGVPPDLLKAMTWWESGWQNGVVSKTGAVGIGQLMPATVRFVSDVLVGKRLDPRRPEDNIRMSARFLGHLLRETGGRADLALAAYYQGLASVRAGRVLPETKHYVAGVLAYRSHF
jgi:soluble lytic murein transglycosylase-like protein